ncbi:MAG: endopeptidase La [Lachnospiraceae bacterium]|nr:endopeptidase La [Lachnospiraceae bacterium]
MPRVVKKKMPMVALSGITVMPGMILHFDIDKEESIEAIEKAMLKGQQLFLVSQNDPGDTDITIDNVNPIGTISKIKQMMKLPGKVVRVLVEGLQRAELFDIDDTDGYFISTIKPCSKDESYRNINPEGLTDEEIEDKLSDVTELTAMVRMLRDMLSEYVKNNPKIGKTLEKHFAEAKDMSDLLDHIAINLPFTQFDRQRLLNAVNVRDRFTILSSILSREIEVARIRQDLSSSIRAKVEKNQKEYVLREQMRFIKKELGEDSSISDADRFKEEVEKLKATDEVKEKIKKEISRFEQVPDNSSESSVQRIYIETLLEMPWDKVSKDNKNIDRAEKVLDEDHYGLKKVKERVLEYLSVRSLTEKGDAPIICLVGPPGTGKTSIAKSVARALNKKYVRISLGGVRDEAEIRGHRRTYVGAMPGRIANGLKQGGVKNPLMLLDEIDKVSSDYKGDTSSALLEVLDNEQNDKFRDHYVEIPLDLSEVLFIATANDIGNIPGPLRDRMEIIEVTSYTENEKFHIAKEHLIKKQLKANGLKASQLKFDDEALELLIRHYTKEAGVRGLERRIGEVCRKSARMILQDGKKKVTLTKNNLVDFLGIEKYHYDPANEKDEVGIVRGLAWTQVGGDTLQIEVNVMPGKGDILLTGQLGDVMKESAQAGLSFIRSIAKDYGISADFFKKNDFHIHIPQGSVPKDGPSAGITMATAVFSAITKKKVRADLAMTGEITLRGRVLPIGGLKEKTLAAKNAGVKTVLVPIKNRPDIEEIDKEITDGLEIVFVETMEEVLERAIV